MPATSSFGCAIGSSRGRVRAAVPPSFAPIYLFGARCLLFAHANPSSRTSLYISMPGICSIACKRNWVKSDSLSLSVCHSLGVLGVPTRGDASVPTHLHTTPAPTATACPSKAIHMWVTALATLTFSSLILEIFLTRIIADVGTFLFQVSFVANNVIVKVPLPELIHATWPLSSEIFEGCPPSQ